MPLGHPATDRVGREAVLGALGEGDLGQLAWHDSQRKKTAKLIEAACATRSHIDAGAPRPPLVRHPLLP
jgi:hypothetical protein